VGEETWNKFHDLEWVPPSPPLPFLLFFFYTKIHLVSPLMFAESEKLHVSRKIWQPGPQKPLSPVMLRRLVESYVSNLISKEGLGCRQNLTRQHKVTFKFCLVKKHVLDYLMTARYHRWG
jgi:hypothetical protein